MYIVGSSDNTCTCSYLSEYLKYKTLQSFLSLTFILIIALYYYDIILKAGSQYDARAHVLHCVELA